MGSTSRGAIMCLMIESENFGEGEEEPWNYYW